MNNGFVIQRFTRYCGTEIVMRSLIKNILPKSVIGYWRKIRIEWQFRSYHSCSLERTFEKIYSDGAWGGGMTFLRFIILGVGLMI
jgi:hypothetical protein